MHCYHGGFFFICPRQPGRPGSRLDWAGMGWRDTAFWYNDLIRPRGFTGAFVASLFSPSFGWRQRSGLFNALSGVPPTSLSVESFFIPFSFRRRPQLRRGGFGSSMYGIFKPGLDEGDVDDADDGLCVRFGLWVR